jgi:hypothetical protein
MRLALFLLAIIILIGCGNQIEQKQVVKENTKAAPIEKKIETKNIAIDFIKCKTPKDCKIDQGYNRISFDSIDLEISQDTIYPDLSSVGEEASDYIDIYSSGKYKKISTYNGIKYFDCYDSNSRYLFYVIGDKLVRIYLYGDKISQEQSIVLNSLSYNLKGNVFNVDYFVNKTNAGTGFEYDPSTGNKVKVGTVKKVEPSSSEGGSSSYGDKVYVPGYYTKKGKYVKGYWRSK